MYERRHKLIEACDTSALLPAASALLLIQMLLTSLIALVVPVAILLPTRDRCYSVLAMAMFMPAIVFPPSDSLQEYEQTKVRLSCAIGPH